jgi:hypothetical protein
VIGIAHGPKDWFLTKTNTENAIEALEDRVKICRDYDVPDLAGYDKEGNEFYIDKNCPETFSYMGKNIEVDEYLILHEEVELALIKMLHLSYQDCHQIACLAEKEAVEMVYGMGCWETYSAFMRKEIDRAWNKKNPKAPPNLYKKPYIDEKEYGKLRSMGYVK